MKISVRKNERWTESRLRDKMANCRLFILDIDGTLFDVSKRYYLSVRNSLKKYGYSCPKKEIVMRMKRGGMSGNDILSRISGLTNESNDAKLEMIESKRVAFINSSEYLKYDKCVRGSKGALKSLSRSGKKIVVLSLRNNPRKTKVQLEGSGMMEYIDGIYLSNDPIIGKDYIKLKSSMMKTASVDFRIPLSRCCTIGDSPTDIIAGRRLGMFTVAVLSGISSKETISKHGPDIIIQDVSSIGEFLPQLRYLRTSLA
jgi:phosphoglycolate phosphatase-like HAD superfamily hydrolase